MSHVDEPPASGLSSAEVMANIQSVQTQVEACHQLLDRAAAGTLSGASFINALQDTGLSSNETRDYVDELRRHLDQQRPATPEQPVAAPDSTTPGNVPPSSIAESVGWALLHSSIDDIHGSTSDQTPNNLLSNELVTLLGLADKGAIPASVLAKAPHLSILSEASQSDKHLNETQVLLTAYSPQSVQDVLVAKAQFAPVSDPLPHTIWRKIILDQFVDFEKLFALMEKGYDHHDDPKDFGADFALVKKEQAFPKCMLHTEADWIQVFTSGVCFFFRHRTEELHTYRTIVMDLFRASPNPLVAIEFDIHVHDKYTRKPYHLDDRDHLNFPLLTQMLRVPNASSVPCSSSKCSASNSNLPSPSTKCADVPCRNWSLGSCVSDPCPNKHKHGVCCVCGEGHQARDSEKCSSSLQSRQK